MSLFLGRGGGGVEGETGEMYFGMPPLVSRKLARLVINTKTECQAEILQNSQLGMNLENDQFVLMFIGHSSHSSHSSRLTIMEILLFS
jgi:hypothetical protein